MLELPPPMLTIGKKINAEFPGGHAKLSQIFLRVKFGFVCGKTQEN